MVVQGLLYQFAPHLLQSKGKDKAPSSGLVDLFHNGSQVDRIPRKMSVMPAEHGSVAMPHDLGKYQ